MNERADIAQSDYSLGTEFLESATALCDTPNYKWLPVYFFICHSLELYIKSFLRFKGFDNRQLTRLRHDLCKCRKAAEDNDINFRLSEPQKKTFGCLAAHHRDSSLRYRVYKAKTFPSIEDSLFLVKAVSVMVGDEIIRPDFAGDWRAPNAPEKVLDSA